MAQSDLEKQARNWMDRVRPSTLMTLVLVGIIGFVIYQVATALPPRQIVLSTGNTQGAYHAFGLEYRERLAQHGIDVQLFASAGSIETMERLQAGTADVGFVQTGTADRTDTDGLTTIASLFYEPIWVFHRNDLAREIETLRDLRGLRIGVGPLGSGTRPVASQLLGLNNVDESNAEFMPLSSGESADALLAGELDAAFMVLSPRADLVTRLLEAPTIGVLVEPRAAAYSRAFPYFTTTTMPEGIVNFARNIPGQDIELLTVTGTLTVPRDAHPNLVRLLLRTAHDIHREGSLLEELGEFPAQRYAELALHPAAIDYFQNGDTWFESNFPFNLAVMLDRLVVVGLPLLTLFTLYRTFQPVYLLHVQYQTTRWYRTLGYVDAYLNQLTLDEITSYRAELNNMLYDLTQRVAIPFFYWNRVYVLKAHIIQVIGRLDARHAELTAQHNAEGASA